MARGKWATTGRGGAGLPVTDLHYPPSGNGDNVPAWVPANAKIHIDFLGGSPQGRAWSNGAEVAIDTLLGSDPNTENGWDTSAYAPANLTAVGYVTHFTGQSASVPALIGAALSKTIAGATIVMQMTQTAEVPDALCSPFVIMAADGNDAIDFDVNNNNTAVVTSYSGPLDLSITGVVNGAGAINRAALTSTDNRFDLAMNGGTAVTALLASDDRPVGNPFVAVVLDPNQNPLQSITIYDPLPDIGGLSELSEP